MRRIAFIIMRLEISVREWPRRLLFVFMLAMVPVFAADTPAPKSDAAAANRAVPSDKDAIVSTTPMEVEAEGTGAHGQLVVAPEILTPDTRTNLIFTISAEPLHGR